MRQRIEEERKKATDFAPLESHPPQAHIRDSSWRSMHDFNLASVPFGLVDAQSIDIEMASTNLSDKDSLAESEEVVKRESRPPQISWYDSVEERDGEQLAVDWFKWV